MCLRSLYKQESPLPSVPRADPVALRVSPPVPMHKASLPAAQRRDDVGFRDLRQVLLQRATIPYAPWFETTVLRGSSLPALAGSFEGYDIF